MALMGYLLVSLMIVRYSVGYVNLSGSPFAMFRQSYTFQCSVSGSVTLPVAFVRSGSVVCTIVPSCQQSDPLPGYSCKCADQTGTSTLFSLTINSVSLVDETNWKCNYDRSVSNNFDLQVYSGITKTYIDCLTGGYPGKTSTIICRVNESVQNGIQIFRGNGDLVVFGNIAHTVCIPCGSVGGYSATIDETTRDVTLTIESFNPEVDVGTWRCADGLCTR